MIALVALGSVVGFLAIFSLWIARELLETDTFTETSTELLEEEDIREPVAGFIVDAVFSGVDVEAEIREALPPDAKGLAGPASAGLRQLADRAANQALQRPRVQELWADAVTAAHTAFIAIVEDKGENLSTAGGAVTLDLSTIVDQIGTQVGIDLSGKLPADAGQIEILDSEELGTVQETFDLLRPLAIALTLAMLALFGLAIYLADGWRRQALRMVGFAFILVGLAALAVRSVAGDFLVDSLASTASVEDATSTTWDILTSLLRASSWSVVAYGVVILLGAWLAGPGPAARSVRRELAPLLRGRALAYGLLAALLLMVFWWNPTPGTARLVSSLILVALAIAGMEALRHQAIKDFPAETMETASHRWRERAARLRGQRHGGARS